MFGRLSAVIAATRHGRPHSLEAGDLEPGLAAALDGGGAGAAAVGLDDDLRRRVADVVGGDGDDAEGGGAAGNEQAEGRYPASGGRLVGAMVVVVMAGLPCRLVHFDVVVGGRGGASGDPLSRLVGTLIAIIE